MGRGSFLLEKSVKSAIFFYAVRNFVGYILCNVQYETVKTGSSIKLYNIDRAYKLVHRDFYH